MAGNCPLEILPPAENRLRKLEDKLPALLEASSSNTLMALLRKDSGKFMG
jgi:hypothetical protein